MESSPWQYKSSKKAMFSLLAILRNLDHPIPVIMTMLKPIMCYGCEIWGFSENKRGVFLNHFLKPMAVIIYQTHIVTCGTNSIESGLSSTSN